MNPNTICFLVFAVILGSALVAMRLRDLLPEQHMNDNTKETVKLTMGLVATMTALILGLLIASTKQAYDTEKSEVTQMAAQIIYLDHLLAEFGTEAVPTRALLRQTVENAIVRMWPSEAHQKAPSDPTASWSDGLPDAVQKLKPQTDVQRAAKADAARIASGLGEMRWLLFEQEETSISMPMLVIVIAWIAVLFFSFGLFSPSNSIATGALIIGALSVSGAIFLILELDHPFDGLIEISSQPMHNALTHLGK